LERLTVKNSPYRANALNALARCLALLGDFPSAQKVMERAIMETDVTTASEALSKACELKPKNPAYYYTLGLVALAQGDLQRALELLKATETEQ